MDLIESALSALGNVTDPFTLIAYLALVVGWLVIAFRVKRNKELLAHIEKLPAEHRLEALRAEMGVPRLKTLTPEQWLSGRAHSYYLVGFLAILATGAVVVTIAVNKPSRSDAKPSSSATPDIASLRPSDETRAQSPSTTPASLPMPSSSVEAQNAGGADVSTPPAQPTGAPVTSPEVQTNQAPQSNTASRTTPTSSPPPSKPTTPGVPARPTSPAVRSQGIQPIIRANPEAPLTLQIINIGSSPLRNPSVELYGAKVENHDGARKTTNFSCKYGFSTVNEQFNINVSGCIPQELLSAGDVTVNGKLSYETETQKREELPFTTKLSTRP